MSELQLFVVVTDDGAEVGHLVTNGVSLRLERLAASLMVWNVTFQAAEIQLDGGALLQQQWQFLDGAGRRHDGFFSAHLLLSWRQQ